MADESDVKREELRGRIKKCRDELWEKDGKSVFWAQIAEPMTVHGSHLIYAPDTAFMGCGSGMASCLGKTSSTGLLSPASILNNIKKHWIFLTVVVLIIAVFKAFDLTDQVRCGMQNLFFDWAAYNVTATAFWRFVSISVLMSLRLLVSNVLPFTSPAFAYLVAKSLPPAQGWQGSFYLLACSMPAGAIVPLMDLILSHVHPHAKKTQGQPEYDEYVESHFQFTNLMCWITDYLPFSFWVRPMLMEPVFAQVEQQELKPEACASAALLAGHFMIWSGAPTSMYQRKFVPDWLTCIVIQPLGLFEDVAVVLATWAGHDRSTQKSAEIGLYIFMMVMNVLYAITNKIRLSTRHQIEHAIIAVLTLVAIAVKWFELIPLDALVMDKLMPDASTTTTTTTVASSPVCQTIHSNVKVMAYTAFKVTVLAFVFRLIARLSVNKHLDNNEAREAGLDEHLITSAGQQKA